MINLTLRSSRLKMLMVSAVLLLAGISSKLMSQTDVEGEMTFTVKTATADGKFSPRHVLAIWIEDAEGFVITRKRRADKRKQYLYTWKSKSGGNVTDATTGATLSSHQSHSISWNCKDVNGDLVPDGEYHVYIEFTEEHAQGPMRKVSFTKGSEPVSLTPSDDANFKDLSLQFEPAISSTVGIGGSGVNAQLIYPNPTNGMLTISLDKDAGVSTIKIFGTNGSMVYFKELEGISSHQVNMTNYESGPYIISVENPHRSYRQKIVRE